MKAPRVRVRVCERVCLGVCVCRSSDLRSEVEAVLSRPPAAPQGLVNVTFQQI